MSYSNKKSVVSFSISALFDILFVVFLVLKLTNVIDWSWWWVTAPLWGQPILAIAGVIFSVIVIFLIAIIHSIRNKHFR